ncbi:MerR family transcriptional regulator [Sphingomonas aestuarii]
MMVSSMLIFSLAPDVTSAGNHRSMNERIDISEVARRTGLSVRALRFYEQRGIVQPLRGEGGRRVYAPGELAKARARRRSSTNGSRCSNPLPTAPHPTSWPACRACMTT